MKTKTVTLDGDEIAIPEGVSLLKPIDGQYTISDRREREIYEHLKALTDESVIDIGANCGIFSVTAAKHTTGRVFAFEPHPDIYQMLQANLAPYPNACPFRVALGEVNRYRKLKAGSNPGGGFISDTGDFDISIRTLDDYGIRAEVIKLDVEGSGVSVLSGGQQTFAQAEIIFFEIHEVNDLDSTPTGEGQLIQMLAELGFSVRLWSEERIIDRLLFRRIAGGVATQTG